MNENVKRWTAKRKMAFVLDIIRGKNTTAEASRSFHLSPSEVETWIDEASSQKKLSSLVDEEATSFAFGINRFNLRSQSCPRHNLIHFSQEFVAPCLLRLGTELNVRKAQLAHDRDGKVGNTTQTINRAWSSMSSGAFSDNS